MMIETAFKGHIVVQVLVWHMPEACIPHSGFFIGGLILVYIPCMQALLLTNTILEVCELLQLIVL